MFGVDTVNQLAHSYTARRKVRLKYSDKFLFPFNFEVFFLNHLIFWKTLCSLITLFGHLLDLAAINASIVFLFNKPQWEGNYGGSKRRQSLLKMSLEMIKAAIEHRII